MKLPFVLINLLFKYSAISSCSKFKLDSQVIEMVFSTVYIHFYYYKIALTFF